MSLDGRKTGTKRLRNLFEPVYIQFYAAIRTPPLFLPQPMLERNIDIHELVKFFSAMKKIM